MILFANNFLLDNKKTLVKKTTKYTAKNKTKTTKTVETTVCKEIQNQPTTMQRELATNKVQKQ